MSHRKNKGNAAIRDETSQKTNEIIYIVKKCENQDGKNFQYQNINGSTGTVEHTPSNGQKNETAILIKHYVEILSLILLAISGFVVVIYLKPITAQDDQITHNFNQVTGYVRNIQQDIDGLNTACRKPINYAKANQYQTDLGHQNVNLVHDFHDKLGLLISSQTYCNLRQVTSAVDKLVNSKNPCDNVPQFTNKQINNLINQVNFDKRHFNSYVEFFKKKRDSTHNDLMCNEIKK